MWDQDMVHWYTSDVYARIVLINEVKKISLLNKNKSNEQMYVASLIYDIYENLQQTQQKRQHQQQQTCVCMVGLMYQSPKAEPGFT